MVEGASAAHHARHLQQGDAAETAGEGARGEPQRRVQCSFDPSRPLPVCVLLLLHPQEETNIPCTFNSQITELLRGVRTHFAT